jgi:hypothetical protein
MNIINLIIDNLNDCPFYENVCAGHNEYYNRCLIKEKFGAYFNNKKYIANEYYKAECDSKGNIHLSEKCIFKNNNNLLITTKE